MHHSILFSSICALALLSNTSLTAALPTELTDFLLVTTSQKQAAPDSASLKNVSATSLFAPRNQPNNLLRLIGPGYGSLPNFTLTSETLHTWSYGRGGQGYLQYNSSIVEAGKELQFLAAEQEDGNLGLEDGYLLSVGGESEGWTVCEGPLEQEVVVWRGVAEGCRAVWVHGVMGAPY